MAKVSKVWNAMTMHATFGAGMLFGWETVMTFVLVSVVYAVAVGEPSFGNVGPYAVGLSLFSMVFAGQLAVFCLLGNCSIDLQQQAPSMLRRFSTNICTRAFSCQT